MKLYVLIATVLTQITLNYAFYDQFVLDRFGLKKYILDLSNVDISKTCFSNEKKCIWKCCPKGQILNRFKACIDTKSDFSNITVYDRHYNPTSMSLESVFKLEPDLMKDEMFAKNALWWYKATLIEDGRLFLKFPNVYNRWREIGTNHFCVEMKKNGTEIIPVFMVEYEIEHPRNPSGYKKWGLILSTIFLLLTLTVYSMVPQLRDFNGIILMVHFCCLIVAFITLAMLESYNSMKLRMSEILVITFFYYFFKLSSLTWTNVMFYRILVTSRQSEDPPSSRIKQFVKYCGYAFGLPTFMTFMTATIELSDMTDMPSFVTPQIQNRGNFSFHGKESLYYLHIPIMLILVFNWSICCIKVVKFCKTSRHTITMSGEQDNQEKTFNRPIQSVKLLTILSFNDFLEMLSVIYIKGTRDTAATFNLCIGLIILITFVGNKHVWKLLKQQVQAIKTENSNSNKLAVFFQKK